MNFFQLFDDVQKNFNFCGIINYLNNSRHLFEKNIKLNKYKVIFDMKFYYKQKFNIN